MLLQVRLASPAAWQARATVLREPHALGDALVVRSLRALQRQGMPDLGAASLRFAGCVVHMNCGSGAQSHLSAATKPLACSTSIRRAAAADVSSTRWTSDQMRSTFGASLRYL